MSVISSPTGIRLYQFSAMVGALYLQTKGMGSRVPVCTNMKKMYGYTGTVQTVHDKAKADKDAFAAGRLDAIKSKQYKALVMEHVQGNAGA